VFSAHREKALKWLLELKAKTAAIDPASPGLQDTTIPGWPWVRGCHGWVEPTALALFALRSNDFTEHPRFREGLHLLYDRAIPSGGWNCGNAVVFGSELRPQPAPTGLTLLALAGCQTNSEAERRAIDYLLRTLPRVRTPRSLAWGILGLSAWGQRPPESGWWLSESFERLPWSDTTPIDLAYLLLATGEPSLEWLGVPSIRTRKT
jgi:hypothetical protein